MKKFLEFLRNLFWAPKHVVMPVPEIQIVEGPAIEVKQEIIETLPTEIPEVSTVPVVEVKGTIKPKRKRGRPRKKSNKQ